MEELLKKLQDRFTIKNFGVNEKGQALLTVKSSRVSSMLGYLKDFEGFVNLILITAVDWIEDGQFQITYIVNHPEEKKDVLIRTFISRKESSMESVHQLWEHAATFQREMKEMFGIDFPGSPGVDDSFLLEGWDDLPPMRRDFDTKAYSENTYFPRPGRETNDPAEFMKKRLYPDE